MNPHDLPEIAAVLREVQAGQTIIVTRNGVPVAELRPVPPRRFVPRAAIADSAERARSRKGKPIDNRFCTLVRCTGTYSAIPA